MLAGVERLADVIGSMESALSGAKLAEVEQALASGDAARLAATDGHFAATARDGQTVRLARTIGLPLRYFVAKLQHGPFLVVADRIDRIYEHCRGLGVGWQFDPFYTRMVPAHHLVELQQVGCPDPNPVYRRFFAPGPPSSELDVKGLGEAYVHAAYAAVHRWIEAVPDGQPIGVLFSGGVDSGSVLLLALHALRSLERSPELLRSFTLDLGGGQDAVQAQRFVRELGLEANWEPVRLHGAAPDLESAIAAIEDYHPLDVECAAASLLLLGALRERYPSLRYLMDGDGGDENLKAYPLEDSDLTLSSVLRNPLLYLEGWGIDAIKHSLTYSGGLSRSYVRTYAPAQRTGFTAFSPYTSRSVIAAALAIPFDELLQGSAQRLEALKGELVRSGVEAVTGVRMPVFPKRRFQDGAGQRSDGGRPGKAWCRRVFLRQWEERLRAPAAAQVAAGSAGLP